MNVIKGILLYVFIIGAFFFAPSFAQNQPNNEVAGISIGFGISGYRHHGHRYYRGPHYYPRRYFYPRHYGYYRHYYGPRYYYYDPFYYYYGRPGGVYFYWYR